MADNLGIEIPKKLDSPINHGVPAGADMKKYESKPKKDRRTRKSPPRFQYGRTPSKTRSKRVKSLFSSPTVLTATM